MKTGKPKGKYFFTRFNPMGLSRLLPLRLPLVIFLITATSFTLSQVFVSAGTLLNNQLARLALRPRQANSHLELGLTYAQMRELELAQKELEIGQNLAQLQDPTQVLGTTTTLTELKSKLESQPKETKKQQEYWQKIAADNPTFRDAWVQLLYLSYNEGNLEKTKENLEKTKALDPNFINDLPEELKSLR